MLDGLKTFLIYVINLETVRIDFPECWRQYTAAETIPEREKFGVFAPYDPNVNLMADYTDKFFSIMLAAAVETKFMLMRYESTNISIDTLLEKIFEPYPRIVSIPDAINATQNEFSIWEERYQGETHFPFLIFKDKWTQENSESRMNRESRIVSESYFKILLKVLASKLSVNSYIKKKPINSVYACKKFINRSIYGEKRTWIPLCETCARDTSKMAKLVIPIKSRKENGEWTAIILLCN